MEDHTKDRQLNTEEGTPQTSQPTELEQVKKERDEYLNGWKRAKADLINFQKDEQKRIGDAANFSQQRFVQELLPILDSFDLALESTKDEAARKGLAMIRGQMEEVLKRQGVERIKVKPGDDLDIAVHEPIGEEELDEKHKEWAGKIVSELVAGYTLHQRVVRPAKVRIGKAANG
ncbi:MAG: nucleotide exchange factor GrpE [Patescibacteria group bacterium]|nr:nucleotide exchange factor GrpE [Patescibacteria group bacterium]